MSETKRPRESIDADDLELFRSEVDGVRPLASDRVRPSRAVSSAHPQQSEASEREVMRELAEQPLDWSTAETGEELTFLRPGLQRRILRRLRRGHYAVAAELDLHEMNTEAARTSILEFLAASRERGSSCVKIIHGKGLRSKRAGPVLKRLTDSLLRRRGEVLAFASAPPNDGGTGAVYVLLKRG